VLTNGFLSEYALGLIVPKGVGSLPASIWRSPLGVPNAVYRTRGRKNELIDDELLGSTMACVKRAILGENTTSMKRVILILSNELSPLRNRFTSGRPSSRKALLKSIIPPKKTCGSSPVSAKTGGVSMAMDNQRKTTLPKYLKGILKIRSRKNLVTN
jgi:hypothetical protein